ncbi:MAG: hypothetical protein ACE37E_01065 [Hyphomicrobiales bacterium]
MSEPKKYMIVWDCGYGDSADIIEAESHKEATEVAYAAWKEDAENNATYTAAELTSDLCENYGFDPEQYGLEPTE